MTKAGIEWKNRVLCSDGNCIGIIGPDGRCKECGLPFEGELPFETELPTPGSSPVDNTPTAGPEPARNGDSAPDNAAGEQPDATSDDEWANRRLCRDGNCIGVIGPDGKCKECGLPYGT